MLKWSEEEVAVLVDLVKQGVSDSKIAGKLTEQFKRTFTRDSVKNKRTRLQIETNPLTVDSVVRAEKARIEKGKDNRITKQLAKELIKKESELEAVAQIRKTSQVHKIPVTSKVSREAVAFILASDWHVEELVLPQKVNYLNEFNLDVADSRINNFWNNSASLVKSSQLHTTIKEGVLFLGGDFISGNIHDELLENTSLRPIDAIIWAQERIVAGIKLMLKETNLNYTIVCSVGNHSRITQKIHFSTEQENSLEYFMYHQLQNIFADEKRVTFQIAEGYHSYLEVCGKTIRFHHGHAIRYYGAIGGIYMSARRSIGQWNKSKHADIDIFGHFHQQKNDGGLFITNGSLIGWNAFAIQIKADYEPPRQKFFLLTNKGEIVGEHPIFL